MTYFEPFLRRKPKKDLITWGHVGIAFLVFLFVAAFVSDKVFKFTDVARAQDTGPMNNKEACLEIQATNALVQGASRKELVDLCEKEGINL